jgi:hypothetical protein
MGFLPQLLTPICQLPSPNLLCPSYYALRFNFTGGPFADVAAELRNQFNAFNQFADRMPVGSLPQVLSGEMYRYLRARDHLVSQQISHLHQAHSSLDQVRGKGVPQGGPILFQPVHRLIVKWHRAFVSAFTHHMNGSFLPINIGLGQAGAFTGANTCA